MLEFPLAHINLADLNPHCVFNELHKVIDVEFWSGYHVPKVNRPCFSMASDDLWFEYHRDWTDYYTEQMLHEIDPVLRFGSRTSFATTWKALGDRFCRTGTCEKFLKSAAKHGITTGVCMATRQVNGDMQIISFASSCKTDFTDTELRVATYFGQILGHTISRQRAETGPARDVKISARALECLELCALGTRWISTSETL